MSERISLIVRVLGTDDLRIRIEYQSSGGSRRIWVPKDAIRRDEELGGENHALVLEDSMTRIGEFKGGDHFEGSLSPLFTVRDDILIVDALENDEALPEQAVDDTIPLVSGDVTMELSERHEWDFDPLVRTAFVATRDDNGGDSLPRMRRVNDARGNPVFLLVFNPDDRSAREPAGAFLGMVEREDASHIIAYRDALEMHKAQHAELWESEECSISLVGRGLHLILVFQTMTFRYSLLEPQRGWSIES